MDPYSTNFRAVTTECWDNKPDYLRPAVISFFLFSLINQLLLCY